MRIDWTLPDKRAGFWGFIDTLIGPGATKAEKNLQLYPPFIFAAGVIVFGLYQNADWNVWQYILVSLMAVDMVGGAITNSTSAAKRWFFREGEGFKAHMTFIAIHLIQITLFSWAFLGFDLGWIAMVYGFTLASCAAILLTPLYLQRPFAALIYCIALLLSLYVFENPEHLEWFLPILFFKLLVSHTLREAPYQP
ncbi:hypothetical protein PhaeoP18_00708 [Phaeobacter piscinae]|uniref:Uncharacterized protein n=1 Tax=Phaeobacter piscinae TaxID=1580596 RepID=A0AAN1GPP1_9RHOB|nr:hypothetical protein [Phaeobacter piscinae]ATG42684.1 hypothetical protein PhaeoP13_00724 [Phaeobacter piscinae]AUR35001.1 hypothetical protein PhaeoP18_00708 [Phaeobacter piscinae]